MLENLTTVHSDYRLYVGFPLEVDRKIESDSGKNVKYFIIKVRKLFKLKLIHETLPTAWELIFIETLL